MAEDIDPVFSSHRDIVVYFVGDLDLDCWYCLGNTYWIPCLTWAIFEVTVIIVRLLSIM